MEQTQVIAETPEAPVRRPHHAVLLVPALSLVLAGCGDSSDDSSGSPSPSPSSGPIGSAQAVAGGTLSIESFAFKPTPLTVKANATVTVTNKDGAPHDVVSDQSGLFETEDLSKDQTGSFKAPPTPGTYTYICSIHPNMNRTLVVT